MIVTPEYLRTHYTSHAATADASIGEMIRAVHGEVEALIQQPLEERSVVWYFEGRKHVRRVLPYTLNVTLTSVEEQASTGAAWTEVDDVTLTPDGYLELATGFAEGRRYRANLTVGLPAAEEPATLSASFTTDYRYGDLLAVVCEMVAVKLTESRHTTAGENRLGVQSITISQNGVARTTTMRNLRSEWDAKLRRFRQRLTF
jgi:hypothetical protein